MSDILCRLLFHTD